MHMRSILVLVAAGLPLAWYLAIAEPVAPQTTSQQRLPGAREEINAAAFTSLQAAFDAIPADGGIVRLPPGSFDISEPLVISRSDVRIEGSGTATVIRNLNKDGKPALIVKQADGVQVKAADKLWRVMLSNFRIIGNQNSGHGIEALMINEIFIHGVTVSHNGGDGIRLDNCYEDPRVSDCLITYNKQTGLNLLGCHDIVVSANQFEENRDALHCFDGFNVCFTGNCVDDHLGDGVVIENTYGSVVSGNMIEECDGRGIVLARDCYGITLSANVIAHNGGGIDLVDAHGCSVSANTFVLLKMPPKTKDGVQPPQLPTQCMRVATDSSRIAITGNSFCDSYIGEGSVKRKVNDQLAGGIVLEATRDVTIVGNTFSGLPSALELRGAVSSDVLFTGNLLVDAPSQHKQLPDGHSQGNLQSAQLP